MYQWLFRNPGSIELRVRYLLAVTACGSRTHSGTNLRAQRGWRLSHGQISDRFDLAVWRRVTRLRRARACAPEMKRAERGPSELMNGAGRLKSECVCVGGFMKPRQQVPERISNDSIVNQTETRSPPRPRLVYTSTALSPRSFGRAFEPFALTRLGIHHQKFILLLL